MDKDINIRLERVASLIKGDGAEKNITRLNSFTKFCLEAWMVIDPVNGAAGLGYKLLSDVLDRLLNAFEKSDQQKIDEIFNQVLGEFNNEITQIQLIIENLTPKASVCYEAGSFVIRNGHGISSVTHHSDNHISLNFINELEEPEAYIAICNLSGLLSEVKSKTVDVYLPKGHTKILNKEIKVVVQRMTF